jgi:hypothetical protein
MGLVRPDPQACAFTWAVRWGHLRRPVPSSGRSGGDTSAVPCLPLTRPMRAPPQARAFTRPVS